MLNRFRLIALGLAFGVAICLAPLSMPAFSTSPGALRSAQGVEQQQQPTSPSTGSQQQQQQMQQEQQQMQKMGQQQQGGQTAHQGKTQVMTGRILMHGGQYVFENNTNAKLTITNPKKAKKYNGDSVKVKGTVNEQAQTIHIAKIKRVSS